MSPWTRLWVPLSIVAFVACEPAPSSKAGAQPSGTTSSAAPSAVSGSAASPPTATAPDPADFRYRLVERAARAMGTEVTLSGYTHDGLDEGSVREAIDAAFTEIDRLAALMSHWSEDSEVSRINAQAGKGPVKVSPETLEVIAKSLWISRMSDGVFDITFASMGKLWRFDHDRDGSVPSPAEVEDGRRRIGYAQIQIEEEAQSVALTSPQTRINLGGIAKGYIMDRAAAVLRKAGLRSFFARAGGDLYVEGHKPWGQPYKVGIRDPRGPENAYFARIEVENHAFSTAGDYERTFTKDGKRYHHIIDPRTGYPATASRSVTIWAKDALTADAIDDAVFILGPERGLELVESIPDCGAVIVDADNRVHVSKRLEGKVQILRPPTDAP